MKYALSYFQVQELRFVKKAGKVMLVLLLLGIIILSVVLALPRQSQVQAEAKIAEELIYPQTNGLPEVSEREINYLNVPIHLQEKALSCEAAALKMALMYQGVSVSEDELMAHIGYDPTPKSGNVWGDPHQAFVGDISGKQPATGYGVYWEPVARAAQVFRSAEYFVNGSIGLLVEQISQGHPVVVWVNAASGRRIDWVTPQGKKIIAISGEHAVTVKGYRGERENPDQIIVNDPHSGEAVFQIDEFLVRWEPLGRVGVIVR